MARLIDTHTHLDFIYSRLGWSATTFGQFKANLPNEFDHNFSGCVSVFCEPEKWNMASSFFQDPDVWFTFGVHPHFADYLG